MAHIIPFPAPQQTSYLRVETKFGPEFIHTPRLAVSGELIPDSDEISTARPDYFKAYAEVVGQYTEFQPLAWIKVS